MAFSEIFGFSKKKKRSESAQMKAKVFSGGYVESSTAGGGTKCLKVFSYSGCAREATVAIQTCHLARSAPHNALGTKARWRSLAGIVISAPLGLDSKV